MKSFKTATRAAASVAAVILLCAAASMAVTFTVSKTADTNDGTCNADCSLREAIVAANGNGVADDIVFAALFNSVQTIALTHSDGDLDITASELLTITGPGARLLTVRQDLVGARVFDNNSSGNASIFGMTISGGEDAADANGAGIRNEGTLTLTAVRITGNTTTQGDGAGLYNLNVVTIRDSLIDSNSATGSSSSGGAFFNESSGDVITIYNSTITNNTVTGAGQDGGGIFNNTSATVNLNNVTISHNTAADSGGGIFDLGTVNIRNTIVANNVSTADAGDEDLTGSYTSTATAGGSNLIRIIGDATGFTDGVNGDDIGTAGTPLEPLLGPLQNNFGQTDTRAIPFNSPAVNTGNNCVFDSSCSANDPNPAITLDQRGTGFTRQSGGTVDKGAFEFIPGPTAAGVEIGGRVTTVSGRGAARVVVTISGGTLAEPRYAITNGFGYYRFFDIPAGHTYLVSVRSKQYEFANPEIVLTVVDNLTELDFIAKD